MAQRIVITEYGIFAPSEVCMRAYAVAKGRTIYDVETQWMAQVYWMAPTSERPLNPDREFEKRYLLNPSEIARDDPALVDTVARLGQLCNTKFCELKIVEIPDGVRWYIDAEKRPSGEMIHEEHRTWC